MNTEDHKSNIQYFKKQLDLIEIAFKNEPTMSTKARRDYQSRRVVRFFVRKIP